jgi:hypothetical protein
MALAAKLGLMALKVLTKPISSEIKAQAKAHPKYRDWFVRFGRGINSFTVWANNAMLSRFVRSFVRSFAGSSAEPS